MPLYVFLGFPQTGLNAGGLQHCVEQVENLGLLEHSPSVQYRKEGVFTPGQQGEMLYPVEPRLSPLCLQTGITWDWFPESWSFGNGVTAHKTLASAEYRTVVHGTDLTLDQFLAWRGVTRLADLELERMHVRHEGWEKYEARWLPGTCPQESHIVHLTWLVSKYRLPEFAYERIQDIIEYGAEPKDLHRYSTEPGKHFSEVRKWDGNAKAPSKELLGLMGR
jgi:hypothetical protein